MVTTTVAPAWTNPQVTPRVSTLLDHATVVDNIEWQSPRGMGTSFNCVDMAAQTAICPDPTEPKDFSGPGAIEGFAFAVYGGFTCKPFDFSADEGRRLVEAAFKQRESLGVERALMQTRFVAAPDTDPGVGVSRLWDAPVDLTPASGPVKAKVGLAVLEGFAASEYAGAPTIHAPVTLASLMDDNLQMEGGKAYSRLGSKIAVGAGYEYPNNGPDGQAPEAGSLWLFATGEVQITRNASILVEAEHDRSTNDIVALAERQYIGAIDCFAAAIRVSVE